MEESLWFFALIKVLGKMRYLPDAFRAEESFAYNPKTKLWQRNLQIQLCAIFCRDLLPIDVSMQHEYEFLKDVGSKGLPHLDEALVQLESFAKGEKDKKRQEWLGDILESMRKVYQDLGQYGE